MSGARKRILWVDDEIEYLRSHITFLETRGYSVTIASGGDEAVRILKECGAACDLVLLDKQMPVKSGGATLEEIKELWPDLPVVMVSGYQHDSDVALGKKYDAYIMKPVDHGRLLLACREIIGAREDVSGVAHGLADRYLRFYTEARTRMDGSMKASDWMSLYTSLAKWDLEIEGVDNESARQMHAGLKSDSGGKFCDFVIENYARWAAGRPGRPMMAADLLERAVIPELREGRGVLVVSLNGMRLDQFLTIEPILREKFSVTAARFMAALPTLPGFCVTAVASGEYPGPASDREPGLSDMAAASVDDPIVMKRIMRGGLARAGVENVKAFFASADGANGRRHIRSALDAMKKAQTFGIVAQDILGKFINADTSGRHSKDAVTDDAAFRKVLKSWFADSAIFGMMKETCGDARTVILTSAHGHIFCDRASEVYEAPKLSGATRCLFSESGSVDERKAFLLEDISLFRLPPIAPGTKCLMARENYYLTPPERSDPSRKRRAGAFRCGGISPEEMVMPLYICRPLAG